MSGKYSFDHTEDGLARALRMFDDPYPIKESILSEDPRKGSFLHGARLTEEQMDTILEATEDYPGQTVSTDQQG